MLDVIPEILRNADRRLAHLAARPPGDVAGFEDIAGESQGIRLAVGRAERAATRSVSVLLLGESGTGKELFAQAIHRASPRRDKPWRAINCAAITTTLLESELFGHVKGASSGADRPRAGAFETADGGTLFLDEVGECSLELQAKLLRVLQPADDAHPCTRRFRPVGGDSDKTANVRIVAATNRDLHAAIRRREFREDLFYRLSVVTIQIPPLRDRPSDIAPIAQRLLDRINAQFRSEERGYQPVEKGDCPSPASDSSAADRHGPQGLSPFSTGGSRDKTFSDSAIAFVKRHDWPGNIRQLYNVILQAVVMTDGNSLDRADIVGSLGEFQESPAAENLLDRPLGDNFKLEDLLNDIQRHYLRRAMSEAHGVKTQAARLLGIDKYQTLTAQLKRLKVDEQGDGQLDQ
jgi:transcriptional regulator with PAS, ATPase and Fis domain